MPDKYTRPFPGVIRIEPAGACNLSCSHCPTGTIKMARGIMRPETFNLILQALQAHIEVIRVVVLYHGGEPLLNKHFVDMVRQIKTLGVPFVKTVSNGMLLTDKVIAGLVEANLDTIEFSLDGQNPVQNNFIRRNCDFYTVIANIKRLIDYKKAHQATRPRIFISSTQFLPPPPEMNAFKDLPPLLPNCIVEEFSGQYAGEVDFKCTWAMEWPHMEVMEAIYTKYKDTDDQFSNYCDHVENVTTIRWNGDVIPCCYDLTSRYVLGNIHETDLAAIWNNKRYQGLRQSIDKMKFIPLCAKCNVVRPNVYLTLKPEVLARFGGQYQESQSYDKAY